MYLMMTQLVWNTKCQPQNVCLCRYFGKDPRVCAYISEHVCYNEKNKYGTCFLACLFVYLIVETMMLYEFLNEK